MRPLISPENDVLTSDSISAFMPAFLKAQAAFKPAIKDATNPHFKSKYVALDGVLEAVAKPLRDCGIAIVQQTDIEDAQTVLITRLIHESGEWIAGRYPVHPVKADPQGEGSALTYARRYALMALVGIAPEDDDGNAATEAARKPVTPDQVATLRDWITETNSDEAKFCKAFGIEKVEELPAAKFDAAIAAFKRKQAA
jgi:hypothetical protein